MRKRFSKTRVAVVALAILVVGATTGFAQDWTRAVSLFNQKQYREAVREFHAVLRANPEYWQAWYYIGSSHFQLKSYEDAVDAFQNYVKGAKGQDKETAAGNYYIGFSLYQLKRYDQAVSPLTSYIRLTEKLKDKVDPAARAALGRSYIFSERYSEALPVLSAVAAEMKTNANNFYYIGFAYHKLNQDDQAITALNQAIAIDARDADTLALLGDIYLARSAKNPAAAKQAIGVGEKLVVVRDDEGAWGLLGQAYLADKQFAKAAPFLDKYAKAHANLPTAWFSLGLALSRSDQFKPAILPLEQAVKLAPTNSAALVELGYAYERDKQFDKALSAYQRAYDASGKRDDSMRESIERVKQLLSKS